jgi:hypothetical protein
VQPEELIEQLGMPAPAVPTLVIAGALIEGRGRELRRA